MVYLSYKKPPSWFYQQYKRRPDEYLFQHGALKRARTEWQRRRKYLRSIRKHNKDPAKKLREQYSGEKSYPLYFARKILKYENPYDKKKSKYDKELFDEYLKKEATRLKRKRRRRRYRHK